MNYLENLKPESIDRETLAQHLEELASDLESDYGAYFEELESIAKSIEAKDGVYTQLESAMTESEAYNLQDVGDTALVATITSILDMVSALRNEF